MINPLNELSSVYMQNIAEGCGCDDKEDKKKECNSSPEGKDCPSHGKKMCPPVVLKGSSSVDGGDTAKPGKDKNYVKPMATEGHCDVEGVECSPTEKKKDAKRMKKESVYSNWKNESQDLLEVIGGAYGGVAGVDGEKNLENPKAKTDNKSNQRITEKSVKNKIKINPPQGMAEAFAELGGVISEVYEIIEETEEEKKKRELQAKTKEHDDKMAGKIAEADMTGAPSIKDAKPAKKTNVKYDPHMKVMAPTIKKESRALSGVLSTIRAKNGMGTVTAKGADKLQAKKEKSMGEEMSVKDQMRISREAAKNRNPNPDHRKINSMKASNPKKDNRTDAQKMTDATGPRPGSNYRGD